MTGMLLALLHRKLPPSARQLLTSLEDVATSTVLGGLCSLPWSIGLAPVLRAIGLDGTDRGELRFWPSFPGTEPDVLLVGPDWAVLIEAKTVSPFGDRQLGREWQILRRVGGGRRLRLVALTPDAIPGSLLWERTCADLVALGDAGPPPSPEQVSSLRWTDLIPGDGGLEAHQRALRADLVWYLELCGLLRPPFAGWTKVPRPPQLALPAWYHGTRAALVGWWQPLHLPDVPAEGAWYRP